jgi:hypothetical protein
MEWFIALMKRYTRFADTEPQKYGRLQRELAEALFWRDEEVSAAAIPDSLTKQPQYIRDRYYDDAEYLIEWLKDSFKREIRTTNNKGGTNNAE